MIHPLTGVILHDNVACWQQAVLEADERKGQLLRYVHEIDELTALLRAEIADELGPAVLPSPRRRTPTQERVAACPRCGGKQMTWDDL